MNTGDAKLGIAGAFPKWLSTQPIGRPVGLGEATVADALDFYIYMADHRPDLLDFQAAGDKWQVVKAWLRDDRLID
jgi:hypothetical protein